MRVIILIQRLDKTKISLRGFKVLVRVPYLVTEVFILRQPSWADFRGSRVWSYVEKSYETLPAYR
jgi:hypothetical protein